MGELEGLTAIVTGAARNIGRAIALDLADGGASLAIITKSDMDSANAVAAEIESKGGKAIEAMPPAGLVRPSPGVVHWFLTAAAAGRLRET